MKYLQVQVISGINLAPKDRNGLSDPYVKMWLNKSKKDPYRTAIVHRSLNPRWNFERWTVPFEDEDTVLSIEVRDWDKYSSDDYMGRSVLETNKLQDDQPVDIAMELKPRKGKAENVTGAIKLRVAIKYASLDPPVSSKPNAATTQLFQLFVQARSTPEKIITFLESKDAEKADLNVALPITGTKPLGGRRGMSPLMGTLLIRGRSNRRKILSKLLELGSCVEYRIEGTKNPKADQLTPVYFAAMLGMFREIQMMLARSKQSSPDAAVHCLLDGNSPLMGAVLFSRYATAKGLLGMGADPSHKNETNVTPLILAARQHAPLSFLEALVKAGGKVNHATLYGSTALYEAARNGHIEAVQYLISEKARPVVHSSGLSPLLAAASHNHMDCALALIKVSKRAKQLDLFMVKQNTHNDITKVNALALFALRRNSLGVRRMISSGAALKTSVVLNGNPFTLGSLLLATETCPKDKRKTLLVFVVSDVWRFLHEVAK